MNNLSNMITIELFDQSKQVHKYKLLDIVVFNDVEYAVMMPEYSLDGLVEIFKMKHSDDKKSTFYEAEKDNYIIMQVYETFKDNYKRYYGDSFKFED